MSSFTTLTVLTLVATASLSSMPSEALSSSPPDQLPRGAATTALFLSAINDGRATTGAPTLSWNATIAQNAKAQVTWLRASAGCQLGQMKRSPLPQVGRGMTYFVGSGRPAPADAVSSWMSERQWYDQDAKTCAPGKQCGDYTLVVDPAWKQLGCAVVACASDGRAIMACEYSN